MVDTEGKKAEDTSPHSKEVIPMDKALIYFSLIVGIAALLYPTYTGGTPYVNIFWSLLSAVVIIIALHVVLYLINLFLDFIGFIKRLIELARRFPDIEKQIGKETKKDKKEAVRLLKQQIKEIRYFVAEGPKSNKFQTWRYKTQQIMKDSFGPDSTESTQFLDLTHTQLEFYPTTYATYTPPEVQRKFEEDLQKTEEFLNVFIERLEGKF